ncbi:hypothetical protein T4E_5035 [Trichinella pseudospiralis]|uniref:Uncharacterized protein n=1 Tax=Trichinella pseudospiralis TaxID=6337 RepID=A0A0V0YDT7_TRIPS|nr:hypothetical protein T4E_5035 [Trichinella pseudospiralis]
MVDLKKTTPVAHVYKGRVLEYQSVLKLFKAVSLFLSVARDRGIFHAIIFTLFTRLLFFDSISPVRVLRSACSLARCQVVCCFSSCRQASTVCFIHLVER